MGAVAAILPGLEAEASAILAYMPPDAAPDSPDAQGWARIRDILHHALGLAPGERPSYLDEACAGNPECRAEVESLLAAASQSGFLDRPVLASASGEQATIAIPVLREGGVVGHYRVVEKVGEGGMGAVYKALDTSLDRFVALKVLLPDRSWDHERRFAREAKAASALNHPNIVTIYEFNRQDGLDYIAMEYVQGTSLDHLLTRHQLPLQTRLEYARQVAGALAKAHSAGIVHRDLKPSNIMITTEGQVKVLDFGLAKREHASTADPDATQTQALTGAGMTVGTPAYMSPEQVIGESEDWRSDIFSFGVILYEMVCGRRPFAGPNSHTTMYQIAHEQPPAVSSVNPSAPPEVAALIARCLMKDRARRPQLMADVEATLTRVGSTGAAAPSPRISRRAALAIGVAGVGLLAVGLWLANGQRGPAISNAAVHYSIEAQKMRNDQPLGEPYVASAADTFEGGWRFRLHIRCSHPGFLYVVNEGPDAAGANRFWILYPKTSSVPGAPPTQDVVTGWYDFDSNPGTEKLWIVWSAVPLEPIEKALSGSTKGRVESQDTSAQMEKLLAGVGRRRAEENRQITGELLLLKHQ